MCFGHVIQLQLPGRSSIDYSFLGFPFPMYRLGTREKDVVFRVAQNGYKLPWKWSGRNTVGEGIFMGFFYLAQTCRVCPLCSCHCKRSDVVLLQQPCKGACTEQIWTQHVNVHLLGDCKTLEMDWKTAFEAHLENTHLPCFPSRNSSSSPLVFNLDGALCAMFMPFGGPVFLARQRVCWSQPKSFLECPEVL